MQFNTLSLFWEEVTISIPLNGVITDRTARERVFVRGSNRMELIPSAPVPDLIRHIRATLYTAVLGT